MKFPENMTREEAASYLNIKKSWLEKNQDKAPSFFKVGNQVRYRKADLDAFISRQIEQQKGSNNV